MIFAIRSRGRHTLSACLLLALAMVQPATVALALRAYVASEAARVTPAVEQLPSG
jgi:hypothetical protein